MRARRYPKTVKGLVFLFFLVTPGMNAKKIHEAWTTHIVLRDYQRPDEEALAIWIKEFAADRAGFKQRYIKI